MSLAEIRLVMSTVVSQLQVSARSLLGLLSSMNGTIPIGPRVLLTLMTRLPPGKILSQTPIWLLLYSKSSSYSHKGPIITYLAKVPDAGTVTDVNSLAWFKIAQDGLSGGVWAVDKFYAAKTGKWSVSHSLSLTYKHLLYT